MKTLISLLFASFALCLLAQESKNGEKMPSSVKSPKPFVALPTDGFRSIQEMETFASNSLHGGGSVKEMTLNGSLFGS